MSTPDTAAIERVVELLKTGRLSPVDLGFHRMDDHVSNCGCTAYYPPYCEQGEPVGTRAGLTAGEVNDEGS